MIILRSRRDADRFEALVEGLERDLRDRETAALLELVGAMRSMPVVEPRPEFAADLRERLMLAAETELSPVDDKRAVEERLTITRRRTPRERRLAVALGGMAIVGATTSMAVAAQGALPGDALYPLKRAIENAEAGLHVSEDAKGSTILANASGRLYEVDQLARDADADVAHIEATLHTFSDQATEATDLLLADYEQTGHEGSINTIRDFAASSLQALGALEQVIPASAEDALVVAAETMFAIDARAAEACPTCGAEGITEVPPPLLASGGQAIDDVQQALSEGKGVHAAPAPEGRPAGKDVKPADGSEGASADDAANAAEDPVSIPSTGAENGTGTGAETGPPDQSTGVSVNVNAGGKGKKDKPVKEVTETVEGAVGGAVEGVSESLDGLGLGG